MFATWKKSCENLESVLKNRGITLLTKICIIKAMVLPVVMYAYETWTIKKAECWRTDAFELWCWSKLLRGLWTMGRSNQSILKEINAEYSLEGLMLKLKLQYLGCLMWRADSLERPWYWERLKARREGDDRGQMVGWHHWLNGHEFWVILSNLGDGEGQGSLGCCSPWSRKSRTRLSDWRTTNVYTVYLTCSVLPSLCTLSSHTRIAASTCKKKKKLLWGQLTTSTS